MSVYETKYLVKRRVRKSKCVDVNGISPYGIKRRRGKQMKWIKQ
jgi:hypothetical protein